MTRVLVLKVLALGPETRFWLLNKLKVLHFILKFMENVTMLTCNTLQATKMHYSVHFAA